MALASPPSPLQKNPYFLIFAFKANSPINSIIIKLGVDQKNNVSCRDFMVKPAMVFFTSSTCHQQ